MVMVLSDRFDFVNFFEIRKFFDFVVGMQDVILFGIGEFDFDIFEYIKGYVKEVFDKGYIYYGLNVGFLMLREVVVKKFKEQNGIEVDLKIEVMILIGVNQVFFMGLVMFFKDGEEVFIFFLMFVSYVFVVILVGGKFVEVLIYEENEFRFLVDDFEKYVIDKMRVFIINIFSNLIGFVLIKKDIEEIVDFVVEYDFMVISDEVYEYFVYDGVKNYSIVLFDGMFERIIMVNGFFKIFVMIGWWFGFVVVLVWVIEKMMCFQMYNFICLVIFVQYVVVKVFEDLRSWKVVEEMRKEYDRRRNFVWKCLNEMGFLIVKLKGVFYIFLCIRDIGFIDYQFSEFMFKEVRVVVVFGFVFGKVGEGYIRISYVMVYEKFEEVMDRMEKVLKEKKFV